MHFVRFVSILLLFVSTSATAETEIFRCPLDDGTIAFQEMPCAEPVERSPEPEPAPAPAPVDDEFDFVNPFDNPEAFEPEPEPALPQPVSQDRAECQKLTRDAIDAIDLEMRSNPYTKEEGQAYLAELRTLTQQLRSCKRL